MNLTFEFLVYEIESLKKLRLVHSDTCAARYTHSLPSFAYDLYLHPSDELFGYFSIKEITRRTCQPAQVSQAAAWGLGWFFLMDFFPPLLQCQSSFPLPPADSCCHGVTLYHSRDHPSPALWTLHSQQSMRTEGISQAGVTQAATISAVETRQSGKEEGRNKWQRCLHKTSKQQQSTGNTR